MKNTTISLYDILALLATEMSAKEIIDDYPELTTNDISACLAYAAQREHRLVTVAA